MMPELRRRLHPTLTLAVGCLTKTAEVVPHLEAEDHYRAVRLVDNRRDEADIRLGHRSNRLVVDRRSRRRIGRRAAILEDRRNCSWHLEARQGQGSRRGPWGVVAHRDNHFLGILNVVGPVQGVDSCYTGRDIHHNHPDYCSLSHENPGNQGKEVVQNLLNSYFSFYFEPQPELG